MIYQNLVNKVVMVTGASSGLGEALARQFGRNACTVYMGARNYDKLKTIADEINKNKGDAIPVKLDVTDPIDVANSAQRMVMHFGRIDVWVNNAGGETPASVLDLTPKQLQEITAVNYFGLVYGTQEAAKQMKTQGQGDIVQILSTSAFTPRENEAAYCGAKAAAEMYSKCAQKELQQYGVRIIPVKPGGMATNFAQNAGLQMPPQAMRPQDIADLILHAVAQPRNILADLTLFRNILKDTNN